MKIQFNHNSLSFGYSSLLAWLPILGIYRLLPGISIAEMILIAYTLLAFIFGKKRDLYYGKSDFIFGFFTLYCCFSTVLICVLNESFEVFWLNRLIRFTFYSICVLVTSKVFFNKNAFFDSFNLSAIVVFAGIAFQYLAYYGTDTYVILYDILLPVTDEVLASIDHERIFEYGVFRPSSFLTEPSAVAQYMVIVLIYNLFSNFTIKNKKSVYRVIIIVSTILLTKSLWGYFLLGILFMFLFFLNINKKHNAFWYIVTPSLALLACLLLLNSSLFVDTFSRIDLFDLGNSMAFTGRFGKYELVETENMAILLFGNGFGFSIAEINAYPNSILYILMGEGIVGLLILGILYLVFMLSKVDTWKLILITVFYILMFGSTIIFSLLMVLIFSCLFNRNSKSESIQFLLQREKHYKKALFI